MPKLIDESSSLAADFWSFSLRTYKQEGVENACLLLQKKYAADVNWLLYCCWVGLKYGDLNSPDLKSILSLTKPWKMNVVLPTRRIRYWMKSNLATDIDTMTKGRADFRENYKRLELEAERLQQFIMAVATPARLANHVVVMMTDEQAQYAAANLALYFQLDKIVVDNGVLEPLTKILIGTSDLLEHEAARLALKRSFF